MGQQITDDSSIYTQGALISSNHRPSHAYVTINVIVTSSVASLFQSIYPTLLWLYAHEYIVVVVVVVVVVVFAVVFVVGAVVAAAAVVVVTLYLFSVFL